MFIVFKRTDPTGAVPVLIHADNRSSRRRFDNDIANTRFTFEVFLETDDWFEARTKIEELRAVDPDYVAGRGL